MEPVKASVWAMLHLPPPDVELHDFILHQMPYAAFALLAGMLAMDEKILGKCLGFSSLTLLRRARAGHFSLHESRRIYALVGVVQASYELFEGNVQAAKAFVLTPSHCFGERSPLKLVCSGGAPVQSLTS